MKISRHTSRDHYDLVVIGAGPSGSAAAITAAQSGLSVLQVEAKQFPRHKVCGGCLNGASIELINRLVGGPLANQCEGIRLDSFQLHHRTRVFTARAPLGRAVDRSALDQTLVNRGRELGVEFRDSVKARVGPAVEAGRIVELSCGGQTRCLETSAVVLATGLGTAFSTPDAQFTRVAAKNSRVGIETIVADVGNAFPDGKLVMAVGRPGYVGMTKIPGGQLHLAAAVDRSSLKHLGPASLVRMILRQAGTEWFPNDSLGWRGTSPLTSRARQLSAERVFLVGDAASYIEPFTGEGIRWALESGMAVVPWVRQTMVGWHVTLGREWATWYSRNLAPRQRLCRALAFGLRHSATRWLGHQALVLRPQLLNEMMARLSWEPYESLCIRDRHRGAGIPDVTARRIGDVS